MLARLHTLADSVRRVDSGLDRRVRVRLGFLALAVSIAVSLVQCEARIGANKFSVDSFVSDPPKDAGDRGDVTHVELPVHIRVDAPVFWVGPLTNALKDAVQRAGFEVGDDVPDDDHVEGRRILDVRLSSDGWWTPLYSAGTTRASFWCGVSTSEVRTEAIPTSIEQESDELHATWSAVGQVDVHGEFVGLSTLPAWRRLHAKELAQFVAKSLTDTRRKSRGGD